MSWTPYEYKAYFTDLYSSQDEDTQATADQRLESLCTKGNLSREPVSKKLVDKIFELKTKDARFFFYFGKNRTIIFVHAIIKKRGDVPPKDIKLAITRMGESLLLGAGINALKN